MALQKSIFSLHGHACMVTGASAGLGKHFAKTLAGAGASAIVLAARRVSKLQELAAEIERTYPACKTLCVALDVTKVGGIPNVFDEVEKGLGKPVSVLVNNAGIAEPKPLLELEEADWDSVVDTNLKGAVFVAKEAARRMVDASVEGSIVNVASILALRPGSKQVNYGAAKAGLVHATRIMAVELLPRGVRVNAICPGYFETEMNSDFFQTDAGKGYLKRIPPGRLGQLSELDGPLLLLASNASSFMTGSHLVVDLGHSNAKL